VKRLELDFGTDRPDGWIEFVSKLIDLKTIIHVKVLSVLIRKSDPHMLADMTNLLQQTCGLSSVDICYGFYIRKTTLTTTEICSMVPSNVKHLAVSVKNLNETKSILERFQYLSSANFYYDYTPYRNEITEWLDNKKKGSTYQVDSFSVYIWLGKNTIYPEGIHLSNKRIKLTDESHQ
jgi:hypothetical protein